jgi:hypothetical protein
MLNGGIAGGDGIMGFRVEIREYRVEMSLWANFIQTHY